MSLPKRDTQYHTYRDYLIWSREHGDELHATLVRAMGDGKPRSQQ